MAKLTQKQKMFCKEYLIDFNATRSAKAAGYSKHTAFTIGIENLKKPLISRYLAEQIQKRAAKVERSALEVIERLWEFSDKDKAKYDGENITNTKSTELLAKHYGLLMEKVENTLKLDEDAMKIAMQIYRNRK